MPQITKTLRTALAGIAITVFAIKCNTPTTEKPVLPARPDSSTTATIPVNPYKAVDKSPMDVTYYPNEYPQMKLKGEWPGGPIARVIYSRPHKKGRQIFGNDSASLCPYSKPWRLGANEATEIQFFKPVLINGKNIPIGRYVLYAIPHPDKWEIIFNGNVDSWGLDIDATKDIFKTELPVLPQSPALEDFTMIFQNNATGAELLMAWDDVKVLLPLTFSK